MAESLKKTRVATEQKRNRLSLQLVGRVSKRDLDAVYTDIRFFVADLQPGFDVISDFSDCQLIYLGGLPTFRKIINYFVTHGVAEVVQVVQENRIISKQIVQYTVNMQGYKPVFAGTLKEAEDKLQHSVKRNGVRFYFDNIALDYDIDGATGKANILNISTSGIAVGSATLSGMEDDQIELKFSLRESAGGPVQFKIKAKIVRADSASFAAEYIDQTEEQKAELWACLMFESQQE